MPLLTREACSCGEVLEIKVVRSVQDGGLQGCNA